MGKWGLSTVSEAGRVGAQVQKRCSPPQGEGSGEDASPGASCPPGSGIGVWRGKREEGGGLGMGTLSPPAQPEKLRVLSLDVRFSSATVELFSASRYVWGLVRDHSFVAGTMMVSKYIMRSADQTFPERWASACRLGGPGHTSLETVTAHVLPALGAEDGDTSWGVASCTPAPGPEHFTVFQQ